MSKRHSLMHAGDALAIDPQGKPAVDALLIRAKDNYEQWLAPFRHDYRRHGLVYFLRVTLVGAATKECSLYHDIDPELIFEGRP